MSRPCSVTDYPEEILSLSMFHPDLSCRNKAEAYVLQNGPEEGSFILRPNTSLDPAYISLTTRISGNKTCNARILIERKYGGSMSYYISDKMKFPSVNLLLNYYREHRIHCKDGIDNLRLLFPLRRVSQRCFVSSMNKPDLSASLPIPPRLPGEVRTKRTVSESQASPIQRKHVLGGSLKQPPYTSQENDKIHGFVSKGRSNSEPKFQNLHSELTANNVSKFTTTNNVSKFTPKMKDPTSMMRCRPPAPLPRLEAESSEDKFYYTTIEANKDFFRETYAFLKENEKCECGLRICDSELGLGWAVHRSQEPATFMHIFFQRGDETTWDMPVELVHKLSKKQMHYIMYLCWEGKQPLPQYLRERVSREWKDFNSL